MTDNTNVSENPGNSYIAVGNVNLSSTWRNDCKFLVKLSKQLPYNTATQFLVFTQKGWKHIHTKSYTSKCIVALLIVPGIGNDSNIPLQKINKWGIAIPSDII